MLNWARFFRLPLLPTVWCHIYAASLIAGQPFLDHIWLVVAFTSVYLYGMGDNDRVDLATDLENNTSRPLASGAISLSAATIMITLVLLVGLAAVMMIPDRQQSLMVAVALIAAWGYNRRFKKYAILGAICLGVVRGAIYYSFELDWKWVAVIALYTAMITLWSTTEEQHPSRKKITLILLLMLPIVDFTLIILAGAMTQNAVFLLAMPIVCRIFVLALSPKQSLPA